MREYEISLLNFENLNRNIVRGVWWQAHMVYVYYELKFFSALKDLKMGEKLLQMIHILVVYKPWKMMKTLKKLLRLFKKILITVSDLTNTEKVIGKSYMAI